MKTKIKIILELEKPNCVKADVDIQGDMPKVVDCLAAIVNNDPRIRILFHLALINANKIGSIQIDENPN
jgi:hypothetical protein